MNRVFTRSTNVSGDFKKQTDALRQESAPDKSVIGKMEVCQFAFGSGANAAF